MKQKAYWLVNETLWYETETFDFQSETRSTPRPSHVSARPRRLETMSWDRLETETSRLRLHPCRHHSHQFSSNHSGIQVNNIQPVPVAPWFWQMS